MAGSKRSVAPHQARQRLDQELDCKHCRQKEKGVDPKNDA